MELSGRIIKGIGGFYYVAGTDGRRYACRARGIFRKDGVKPLVGDAVRITVTDEAAAEGSVEEIFPRKNVLRRPEAANVDQALVVFACASPEPNLTLLDRFLVTLAAQGIPCILLFNKKDLADAARQEELLGTYCGADVSARCITARQEGELQTLLPLLKGRTTILAGPSGVGKSTILNGLCPDAGMETGEISRKLKRGKHTTRHAELFAAGSNTYLMDTPGFTALDLDDMAAEELSAYYPEFAPYEGRCRFQPCSHTHEPGCAVRAAAERGEIGNQRLLSYGVLYLEQRERRKY